MSLYSFGDNPSPNSPSSSTSTVISLPTPSIIQRIEAAGCFSDSTSARALKGALIYDDAVSEFYKPRNFLLTFPENSIANCEPPSQMTIEKCYAACDDYKLFGLEYGRECYCGNELRGGSQEVLGAQCNMKCAGNPAQFCGAGDRLNIYRYVASSTTITTTVRIPFHSSRQITH